MGIHHAKIDALSVWREARLFTDEETAALNYAEAFSNLRQPDIQAAHDRLTTHFDASQIETLLMAIVNMDMWTQIFLTQRRQAAPA